MLFWTCIIITGIVASVDAIKSIIIDLKKSVDDDEKGKPKR